MIVGYANPAAGAGAAINEKTAIRSHPLLEKECMRVVSKLSELNIPEWKEKGMNFAIAFKFVLK